MKTLQDIKDQYYRELELGVINRMGLDEFIRAHYEHVYDAELNFIGYSVREWQQ